VKILYTDRDGFFHASLGMRVANMKTTFCGHHALLRNTTMSHVPCYQDLDDLKERVMDVVTLLAVIAAIVALNAVMFVAVYRWSRYAPIFPPDGSGPAIVEPWSE
jgi:hypothetical protein